MTIRDLDAHESPYGHLMNDPVLEPERYCEDCLELLGPFEDNICDYCKEDC